MPPIHRVVTSGLLAMALTGVPADAAGQLAVSLGREVRPGTRISIDRLAEFVGSSVMIGETEKNLPRGAVVAKSAASSVVVRLDLVSRETGVVSTWRSEARPVEPGRTYPVYRHWIPRLEIVDEAITAPLKPAEFVIFRIGQKTDAKVAAFPDVCFETSHAVLVAAIVVDDRRTTYGRALCLCFDVGH